jgi:hypothetical protein
MQKLDTKSIVDSLVRSQREVKYGRIDNVVVFVFPDRSGAQEWVLRLEAEKAMKNMRIDPKLARRIG